MSSILRKPARALGRRCDLLRGTATTPPYADEREGGGRHDTPPASPPDEELARRALSDRSAFSELYEAHVDRVYRYLLARTSSPSDAEELTSRTFLRALAHLEQYRGHGGFGSWLMTIAHNLLVNWYRDRGRRPPTADLDAALQVPASTPGPESSLEANESIERVRGAVGTLAADRQLLIALKYVDGLSNAEIGRMMGRTEGAVKSLHHRTLRELQRQLGERDEQAPGRRGGPP